MTRCGDIVDFSLRVHIAVIFLLPAEVLVTDSESHIPISYLSLIVTMALSGLSVLFVNSSPPTCTFNSLVFHSFVLSRPLSKVKMFHVASIGVAAQLSRTLTCRCSVAYWTYQGRRFPPTLGRVYSISTPFPLLPTLSPTFLPLSSTLPSLILSALTPSRKSS